MQYLGKQYSVVQGIDTMWKWSVDSLVGHTKSDTAPSRPAGIKTAGQSKRR
ncbi:MAG: hypothetical protein JWR80_7749 [Bradyrhizobium sp.]|nr:hypothetical protein [Bradyrhizobium sp.]